MPGNIIQTPQPATVRSVGCIFLHLRTKIAAGYVLILFVIFGIVYIWLNEQHRRQELEITSQKIRCLRKDIHEVYVKMVDLSLIGETVLDWNEEDMAAYHKKRLEVDSRLYPGYPLVDFMCEKDMSDPSILYQAEIHDEESIELLRGLSVYHLIDEIHWL